MRHLFRRVRAQKQLNAIVRQALRTTHRSVGRVLDLAISRWRPEGVIQVQSHGVKFDLLASADDGISALLYYGRPWEEAELKAWIYLCPHFPTILDIGANTGVYSIIASKVAPNSQVVAFEPSRANFARLGANLSLNSASNVTPKDVAIGNQDDTIYFTVPADDTLSVVSSAVDSFTQSHADMSGYHRVEVEQRSVDSMVASGTLPQPDLIKLDVESYEYEALCGMRQTLREAKPIVTCEVFDHAYFCANKPELRSQINAERADQVEELFAEAEYFIYAITPRGLHRVANFASHLSDGANYVCLPVQAPERFLPFSDPDAWRQLAAQVRACQQAARG